MAENKFAEFDDIEAEEDDGKRIVCGTKLVEVKHGDQAYLVCPNVINKKTLTAEDFSHFKGILKEVY